MRTSSSGGACARRTSGSTSSTSGPTTRPESEAFTGPGRCCHARERSCCPTPLPLRARSAPSARRRSRSGCPRCSSRCSPTASGQRVALSFDDGPDPAVTPYVLDALARHGARATFFSVGRLVEAWPELARRVAAEGHELGNHSWRHSRWEPFSTPRAQIAEMERGARAIAAIVGNGVAPLYRAPFGVKSPPFVVAAHTKRLTMVAWSVHGRDTGGADAEQIAARVLRRVRPGDIVLLHDGHDRPGEHRTACADAVRRILAGLRDRKLECVTVSELIGQS
ncbi:MAG: polysaccharide deacetylase family protein [Deltaproteobacteria bacterium]|nr:MAG: polysaccharide deacetylase family protein [Deltaproteobacteria bacterium]